MSILASTSMTMALPRPAGLARGVPRRSGIPSSSSSHSAFARGERGVACRAKKTHTVQKGEWLSSIAPQYNVTTEQLRKANSKIIEEGDVIFPGDQLVIPGTGGGVKGILVKVMLLLLVIAAASGIWPTIKESQK